MAREKLLVLKAAREHEYKCHRELQQLCHAALTTKKKERHWAQDLFVGLWWDCKTSPTGKCVYDKYLDPRMDHCVFCGEPSERK